MEEFDIWYIGLDKRAKLRALIYAKSGDRQLANSMSVPELITDLNFPPLNVDKSNQLCPCYTLQNEGSITDQMLFDKWHRLTVSDKECVFLGMQRYL